MTNLIPEWISLEKWILFVHDMGHQRSRSLSYFGLASEVYNEDSGKDLTSLEDHDLISLDNLLKVSQIMTTPSIQNPNREKERVFSSKISTTEIDPEWEIAQGESHTQEFKSSLVFDRNIPTKAPDYQELLKERMHDRLMDCLKAIAGFANSMGGCLWIGVLDQKNWGADDEINANKICGVEDDFKLLKKKNDDEFLLWIHDQLESSFEPSLTGNCFIRIFKLNDRKVVRIQVIPRTTSFTYLKYPTKKIVTDNALKYGLFIRKNGTTGKPVGVEEFFDREDVRKGLRS